MNIHSQIPQQLSQRLGHLALRGGCAIALSVLSIACSDSSVRSIALTASSAETATHLQTPPATNQAAAPAASQPAIDANQAADMNSDVVTASDDAVLAPAHKEADSVEVGDDGEPDEPLTANIERLELQPDMPYGAVRSLVMAEGWLPYTEADGATPDVATIAVQKMHELGFPEAQSCSGTGQGFCLFEFSHINDIDFPEVRLAIITTPSIGESYGEPRFNRWRIDNYEPEASDVSP